METIKKLNNVLAIESSGIVASVAVAQESKIICEYTINNKKTHSHTLMPMIEEVTSRIKLNLEELDLIAVSKGPGSFTGLRIGGATAKGIAHGLNIPIIGVSSLEALAYNISDTNKIICPVMDARRNQVYTTLYKYENGSLCGLIEETVVDILDIIEKAKQFDEDIIFIGDGFYPNKEIIDNSNINYSVASINNNIARASTIAMLGLKYAKEGRSGHYMEYVPVYLRKSQAEREYELRNNNVN
jgi:tRNA threonylcarbamoyladenosine biosynthesis protein TsaB